MLWIIVGAMLLCAVMIVVVPLYREQKRLSVSIIAATVAVTALSAVIYNEIGAPGCDEPDFCRRFDGFSITGCRCDGCIVVGSSGEESGRPGWMEDARTIVFLDAEFSRLNRCI